MTAIGRSRSISLIDQAIIEARDVPNVLTRCEALMSQRGPVGHALNGLAIALRDGWGDFIHFIQYGDLVAHPEATIAAVYDFLELGRYQHDFGNVVSRYEVNDSEAYGIDGLHDVRPTVAKTSRNYRELLPDHIIDKYKNWDFWNYSRELAEMRKQSSSGLLLATQF